MAAKEQIPDGQKGVAQPIGEKKPSQAWRTAGLPILVFAVGIVALAILQLDAVWNPPDLISLLNIVFLTGISLFISAIAARSYLSGRSVSVLLLGCGTLALGLGGIAASLYLAGPDTNSMVSVYNTMACLAGLCYLASATGSISQGTERRWPGWPLLSAAYLAIAILAAILIFLVHEHIWPVHFVEGLGATVFGMIILWSTAAIFALSAFVFLTLRVEDDASFRRWYGMGLGLIAIGLVGVSLQKSLGDPLNWVGRISQYIGMLYMLVAVVLPIRESGEWLLPMERALLEMEEKFRILGETSPAAILIYQNGRHVYVNPAAESISGYRRDELMKMSPLDVVHPDYREKVGGIAGTCNQGIQLQSRDEMNIVTKDGMEKWLVHSSTSIRFNNKPADLVIAFDITERKQAEARLQEKQEELEVKAEELRIKNDVLTMLIWERKRVEGELRRGDEQFRTLIHNLEAGVALLDEAGRFSIVNRTFLRLFGLDEEATLSDVNGQDWSRWQVFDEKGSLLRVDDHPIRKAAMTGKAVTDQVVSVLNPGTDELAWIRITAVPLLKEDGSLESLICTYFDITDIKKTEDALKVAKQQAELYLDLMGHDINNMHQIAIGYLELALDTLEPEEDGRGMLAKPLDALQRSGKLIDNVRKLQKAQAGEYKNKAVDMDDVLKRVIDEYRDVAREHIIYSDGQGPHMVMADELLYDVFTNLVGNAVKHSSGTDVDISIVVDRVGENGKSYHRVMIDDNGPGIPDSMKENIFNRLERGKTMARGTGLGLYLVKTLVDEYHGRVWVEDRVRGDSTKGARFVVVLPAAGNS